MLCTLATGWLGRRACGAESIPRTYGAARLEGARGAVSIVRALRGRACTIRVNPIAGNIFWSLFECASIARSVLKGGTATHPGEEKERNGRVPYAEQRYYTYIPHLAIRSHHFFQFFYFFISENGI